MQEIKFLKTRNVKSPSKANPIDAGFDFYIPDDFQSLTLSNSKSVIIPSGIRANVPKGYSLVAFNKSGVATKKGLSVGACVIDHGYQGEIHLHLVKTSNGEIELNAGDKIIQFLLLTVPESQFVEYDNEQDVFPEVSDRGHGGFGSSGVN